MTRIAKQANMVLKYLERGTKITSSLAWRYWGISRLASCIFDLRKRGILVETEMVWVRTHHGKARVARYSL